MLETTHLYGGIPGQAFDDYPIGRGLSVPGCCEVLGPKRRVAAEPRVGRALRSVPGSLLEARPQGLVVVAEPAVGGLGGRRVVRGRGRGGVRAPVIAEAGHVAGVEA